MKTEHEPSPSRGHNLKTMLDLEPKRDTSDRSSSPVLSQISARTDRSKGQTENFNGEPDTSTRSSSPSISQISVRTDQSMDHPANFRGVPISWESDRSRSPGLSEDSERTERSKDQIENFNREPGISKSELATRLLTTDELKCSICNEVFMDPVNIPCGHSFCNMCINSHWQQPDQQGLYKCPYSLCPKEYSTRPELYPNELMVQILKWAKYSPVLPALSYARPGEVACDICKRRKLKAAKFCVTCSANYCENHMRAHYTVPALRKHQWKEVTEEPPISSSNPESIPTDKADALKSCHVVSPLAGSICPQMMTPPTGTSGASQCGSLDSDPKRPVKRGHDESPPHPSKHMKIARKLQFNGPDDQEDTEAESGKSDRSTSPSFSQDSDDSDKSKGQIENVNREPDISKRSSHRSILHEKLMKMRCDIIANI